MRSSSQTPLSNVVGTSKRFGQFDHKHSFSILSYLLCSIALYLNRSRLIHPYLHLIFFIVITFSLFRYLLIRLPCSVHPRGQHRHLIQFSIDDETYTYEVTYVNYCIPLTLIFTFHVTVYSAAAKGQKGAYK